MKDRGEAFLRRRVLNGEGPFRELLVLPGEAAVAYGKHGAGLLERGDGDPGRGLLLALAQRRSDKRVQAAAGAAGGDAGEALGRGLGEVRGEVGDDEEAVGL